MNLTPLSYAGIAAGLASAAGGITVRLLNETDSTNAETRRLSAADGRVCLCAARAQTAGRGRLGRSFFSPPDSGLYMTLAVPVTAPLDHAVGVTAAAAVAACRAVRALTGLAPGIKWVNDLWLGERKVCGILTEAVAPPDPDRPAVLLVGLGLNLSTAAFPDGLRAPAGSLADFLPGDAALDAGVLCGTVARELLGILRADACFSPDTLSAYRERLLWKGCPVTCVRGNECFSGVLRDVDDRYRLIVDADSGPRLLDSGEISVRLAGTPL